MSSQRFHLAGLFAVLLALMGQLGAGAFVPRIDPVAGTLCHADDGAAGTPSQAPGHPADCPLCPLCIALHGPSAPLVPVDTGLAHSGIVVVVRPELPPPSTAPPTLHRPTSQPRAPPAAF